MRRLILRAAAVTVSIAAIAAVAALTPVPTFAARTAAAAGAAFMDASAALGFRLTALTVEGRAMTARADILGALDAEAGTPIAAIDVAEARVKVEALPWVRSATVERRLPGTIHIVLEERIPYALWQHGERYTLVDHEGNLIVDVPEAPPRLPLIVGPDAPANAADLFTVLRAQPDLAPRVKAAVRVGARRWNLYLDTYEGGVSVRLPEENVAQALTRLAELERGHGLLQRDLEFIDLRLEDRLIVRLRKTPGETDAAQAGVSPPPAVPVKHSF